MKQAFFYLYIALAFCLFTTSTRGATITWAPGNSGNWSNPTNWNPNQVPGPSDVAIITASGDYTVTLDTNTSVGGLVLGAGNISTEQTFLLNGKSFSLTGPATVNTNGVINLDGGILNCDQIGDTIINGTLTCPGGALSGTITIASNAVANLVGIDGQTTPISLNALILTNCGTVVWSNIDLNGTSGPQIYNYGLWEAQSDNTFYGGSESFLATFNNFGTVRKDGGSTLTTFDSSTYFTNSGTVDAETGEINLTIGIGGGVFNTASNALIWLGVPYYFTLVGDGTFTGSGLVEGNLNGNNGIIHGALTYYYGTLSGTLTVASNAVANLVGIDGQTTPISLNALILTNCGTVVWSNIDLNGTSGPQIYNYGLWEAQSDNTFYGGSESFLATFNNFGTVRKDGGSSLATFDSATTFNNSGKTDIQTGSFSLDGSCSLTNGTLNFGISGPSQFGSIYFAGSAPLGGRLSANFRNHYSPAASNSFPVVVYNSETGMFSSLSLPPLSSGFSWQTSYGSTSFLLSVVSASPLQLSAGLSVSGNSISLSWNGLSGQTYQVQCTTNLAPANWVNLGASIPGTNGPIMVLDAITSANPQKYYRIELP